MSEWKKPWWIRLLCMQPEPVIIKNRAYGIDLSGSSPKWRKMFLKALAEQEGRLQKKREVREKKVQP